MIKRRRLLDMAWVHFGGRPISDVTALEIERHQPAMAVPLRQFAELSEVRSGLPFHLSWFRHYSAKAACRQATLSCVFESARLPIDKALRMGQVYFGTLAHGPVAQAMIRTLFFARLAGHGGMIVPLCACVPGPPEGRRRALRCLSGRKERRVTTT